MFKKQVGFTVTVVIGFTFLALVPGAGAMGKPPVTSREASVVPTASTDSPAAASTPVATDSKLRPVRKNMEVEDLGTPVQARSATQNGIFKEPQSGQYHLLITLEAFNGLGKDTPFQIYDLNLETGAARIVNGIEGRPGPHSPFLHSNGKVYIGTSRPAALCEFDPVSGQVKNCGKINNNYFNGAQSLAEREDGLLYIGLYGLHLAVYDPKAGKLEDLGKMSDQKNGYVYYLGLDGDQVHCKLMAYGAQGLVIYDTKTRKQNYYLQDAKMKTWTRDGQAIPPEAAPKKVKLESVITRSTGILPLKSAAKAGYEINIDDLQPTGWNEGEVAVKWRKSGETEWREKRTKGADVQPNCVKRLAALPDGKLIGMGAFYSCIFLFDPQTKTSQRLGFPPGSVYDLLVDGDRVYFSGYPTMFAVFDYAKPWTWSKNNPDGAKNTNPFAISRGGKYNYDMALGADGRVYIGGNHERHDTGSSLNWFDPKTCKFNTVRDEFKDHQLYDLTAVDGGKLIVMGYGPKLAVFDTAQQKVVQTWKVPTEIGGTGKLMAAGPSAIMGLVRKEVENKAEDGKTEKIKTGLLYKMDLTNGKILFQKPIAGKVFAGATEVDLKRGDQRFCVGPDGSGWLFIDEDLCRINPADGAVERVMPMKDRGRMLFVGDDLYIYNGGRQSYNGFAGIKRIRNVFE